MSSTLWLTLVPMKPQQPNVTFQLNSILCCDNFSNLARLYLSKNNTTWLDKVSLKQFTHQMGNSMPEKKKQFLFHQSLFSFVCCTQNRKHLLTSAILGLLTVYFMQWNSNVSSPLLTKAAGSPLQQR